ncbi:class III lanthionine synthetase LanKC [Actinomadura sp. WMMB 499]|uniref:class III lanthionine synthetase LanKC n=1 Tax=Actinomadura sp. WMMB 499 TaxID=1219491 RepID=UPI001248C6B5|nr:class III lanthionine synthetase LanKC [Actinomadura sp. WMMB 499]QFG21355.1 protein kinase/lanthionine synthetase C family protein [Actinomadura sp. WMMB 499]
MDLRYHAYGMVDPVFYDAPSTEVPGEDDGFSAGRQVPDGWTRQPRGVWTMQGRTDGSIPDQGWKIHVSAGLHNAEEILDIVAKYCVEHDVFFKYLRSRRVLLARNSKYAERGGSGKFMTIYPADERVLEQTLRELGGMLEGQRAPYILSDLRWGSGPLFVRYGGFRERSCRSEYGEPVPAIETPDGRLVPDHRDPVFRVPDWVTVPACLEPALAARDTGTPDDFPFEIHKALHFSNGGGLYRATDTRTGGEVLVKEARPMAGLDRDEDDAVVRLDRERRFLERMADLDCIPRMVDHRVCWEHHFLVREFVAGETLSHHMVRRNPLLHVGATADEIAGYAAWALDILEQIELALDELHRRGAVFGDLHPGNIIVRDDDTIAFVDFELVADAAQATRPALGAPGYQAPPGYTGVAVDRYALGCIRLAVFMSLTAVLRWDDGKVEQFIEFVTGRFPLPADYAGKVRADIRSGTPSGRPDGGPPGASALWPEPAPASWDRLRDSIAGAILSAATPHRTDRLFPGDIEQFATSNGGIGFGHGAAGVLWALAESGAGRFPEHEDWLVRAVGSVQRPPPGFFDGVAGVAYALDRLGRRAEALEIMEHAPEPDAAVDRSLFRGLAGIGLNQLHFARSSGDRSYAEAARATAERLVRDLDRPQDGLYRAGLMYGSSGPALFLIRLFEATGDRSLLDHAERALRRDLDACKWTQKDRTLQVDEGWRVLPYVATGSAGIGLVLHEYLRHRAEPEFQEAQEGVRRAAEPHYFVQSGLFNGRAGILAYLLHTGAGPGDPAVRRHLRNIGWHAVPFPGRESDQEPERDAERDAGGAPERIAFIGDQLLRLSMDLATGSAGVLLTLGAALSGRPLELPFLSPAEGADR